MKRKLIELLKLTREDFNITNFKIFCKLDKSHGTGMNMHILILKLKLSYDYNQEQSQKVSFF